MVSSESMMTSAVRRSSGRASKGEAAAVGGSAPSASGTNRETRARTRLPSRASAALRRKRSAQSTPPVLWEVSFTGARLEASFLPDSETARVKSAWTPVVGSTGTGLRRPPSARSRPFSITGVMMLGIAIEARMAASTGPRCSQTSRRLEMSAATAVNGIGRSSMRAPLRISLTLPTTRSALMAPGSEIAGSSRRRTSRWVRSRAQSLNSGSFPAASSPPMSAPMDVPAIVTISWPRSWRTSMAPMWA